MYTFSKLHNRRIPLCIRDRIPKSNIPLEDIRLIRLIRLNESVLEMGCGSRTSYWGFCDPRLERSLIIHSSLIAERAVESISRRLVSQTERPNKYATRPHHKARKDHCNFLAMVSRLRTVRRQFIYTIISPCSVHRNCQYSQVVYMAS